MFASMILANEKKGLHLDAVLLFIILETWK